MAGATPDERGPRTPPQRQAYLLTLPWPPDAPGGVNEVVVNLAQRLRTQAGYDPLIAIPSWDSDPLESETRGIEVVKVRMRLPFALSGGLRMLAASLATLPLDLWRLAKLLRARRVAVVNVHFPDFVVCAFLLLKVLGIFRGELLLSFHGGDLTGIKSFRGFYRALWQTLITRANGVVVCSEALRRDVLRVAPRARVVTIPNGADFELFDHPRRRNGLRRSILHVGKFEHKKSQDVLLRAVQLLLQTIPDASLTLVGANGPALDRVRALVRELTLAEHVTLHVDIPHEQLPQFFDQADVFVLPSRAEPFGIVLLEAGGAGLPVVATAVGGIPEMIEDGVTGVLVAPDNIVDLERAIRMLLVDTVLADRVAAAWHAKAVAGWSWDRTCQGYLNLIDACRHPAEQGALHGQREVK